MLDQKTRSQGQILENFVYTLEGTVLIQNSWNFIRNVNPYKI